MNLFRQQKWTGGLDQHKNIRASISGKELSSYVGNRGIIRCQMSRPTVNLDPQFVSACGNVVMICRADDPGDPA
jgi:hypothetical protein